MSNVGISDAEIAVFGTFGGNVTVVLTILGMIGVIFGKLLVLFAICSLGASTDGRSTMLGVVCFTTGCRVSNNSGGGAGKLSVEILLDIVVIGGGGGGDDEILVIAG